MAGRSKDNKALDRIAIRVANVMTSVQNIWAKWLNRIFNPLSRGQKRLLVIALASIGSIVSFFFLIEAISQKTKQNVGQFYEKSIPVKTVRSPDTNSKKSVQALIKRILEKEEASDSLENAIGPGLRDSIEQLRTILNHSYDR